MQPSALCANMGAAQHAVVLAWCSLDKRAHVQAVKTDEFLGAVIVDRRLAAVTAEHLHACPRACTQVKIEAEFDRVPFDPVQAKRAIHFRLRITYAIRAVRLDLADGSLKEFSVPVSELPRQRERTHPAVRAVGKERSHICIHAVITVLPSGRVSVCAA